MSSKKPPKGDKTERVVDLSSYYERLSSNANSPIISRGKITRVTGSILEAHLPNAKIGEVCRIEPQGRMPIYSQIVGFNQEDVYLTPLDPLSNIGPKTAVVNTGEVLKVGVGEALLGRVVDSLGNPIDGKSRIETSKKYPVRAFVPNAMKREIIDSVIEVGVRAIDTMLTLGEGQRIGVFATAGVGKSSLLSMIARNSKSDVNVIALVGERGREVKEFIQDNLGEEGLKNSIIVVSTSDEPALRRITAAYTATAIAEYFRDQGKKVMLLMDSATRFARALREVALSLGEIPARAGYPSSVFAALPELFERAGKTETGSITALYTVLLSSELIEDPLGEEVKAILDGHIILSSELAHGQNFPAIDVLKSNSRLMNKIADARHRDLSEKLKKILSTYQSNKDLISIGAYKSGTDKEIDQSISKISKVRQFLSQGIDEKDSLELALEKLEQLFVD